MHPVINPLGHTPPPPDPPSFPFRVLRVNIVLVISSNISKQLLGSEHGQGRNRESKHTVHALPPFSSYVRGEEE